MRILTVVVCSLLFAGLAWAQPSPVAEQKPAAPEALKAEIEALKAAKVAWREIAWKSCLLVCAPAAAQDIPEEARRHLQEALGVPFVVFRDKVQDGLKLSDEQKKKLDEELQERVQDAMQLFQKLDGLKPEEREKELGEYRPKVHAKLAAFLKQTLKDDQLKRLRQIELQQEGAFALGRPDIGKELKVTDKQRKQLAAVVQEFQKKIEPLVKEAQKSGKPEEIRPKAMKIRQEQEGKVEALLTDAQKKQWKEMLGEPLKLDD